MVKREDIEAAIIHANLCLKRYAEKGTLHDRDMVKSMILTWLNKACLRSFNLYGNYRERKAVAKGLKDTLFFIDYRQCYVTEVIVKTPLQIPALDYEALNLEACKRLLHVSPLTTVSNLDFNTIKQINFL